MQVEHEFLVGISDVDFDNKLTNKAMIEAFSNMANIHGYLVGQGSGRREEMKYGWVVLNWKLEVYERPEVCETYKVITWPQSYNKLKAFRDFLVYNQEGKLAAKASSLWLAMDLKTSMPLRLTDELMEGYGSEVDRKNFPDYVPDKGKAPESVQAETTVRIMRSMIDCYNHVHNSCYFDLLSEVLPEGVSQNDFTDVEVVYKKEVKPGTDVLVTYTEEDDVCYGVIKSTDLSTIHAVIIMKK